MNPKDAANLNTGLELLILLLSQAAEIGAALRGVQIEGRDFTNEEVAYYRDRAQAAIDELSAT